LWARYWQYEDELGLVGELVLVWLGRQVGSGGCRNGWCCKGYVIGAGDNMVVGLDGEFVLGDSPRWNFC